MKRFAVVAGICASFLLGAALTALAQDEHQNDRQTNDRQDNTRQDNARPDNARPNTPQQDRHENRQDQARPQEQARPQDQARPDDRQHQQPESGNRRETTPQSEGRQPQDQQSGDRHMQGRDTYDNGHSNQGRPEGQARGEGQHRDEDQAHGQEQPGGRRDEGQRRIEDSEFREHFGREHRFAPGRLREYQGRPSFGYGGYTFELVDGWPEGWSYDDDDCYVDYMDGSYWLFNDRHPGVRVALILID